MFLFEGFLNFQHWQQQVFLPTLANPMKLKRVPFPKVCKYKIPNACEHRLIQGVFFNGPTLYTKQAFIYIQRIITIYILFVLRSGRWKTRSTLTPFYIVTEVKIGMTININFFVENCVFLFHIFARDSKIIFAIIQLLECPIPLLSFSSQKIWMVISRELK